MLNLKMIDTVMPFEIVSFLQNQHYPSYAILIQTARVRRREAILYHVTVDFGASFHYSVLYGSLSHVSQHSEQGPFQDA
ncbi:hypothetical protein B7W85_04915 [Allorhizobium ampelinum]|nr:hypothetical protein B7W85_04915 [Allorhizobium ampelinum]